jgi:hypothetical protein
MAAHTLAQERGGRDARVQPPHGYGAFAGAVAAG